MSNENQILDDQQIDHTLEKQREFIDFRMVTFSLGDKDYGIDIMHVKEISRVNEFTYIPNSANYVRGVYNLRGEIISVMDLRKLFNLPIKVAKDGLEDMIVINTDDHMAGVICDSIARVVGVNSSRIQPPHPFFADINISFIKGVVELDDKLFVILDVERILSASNKGEDDLDEELKKDTKPVGFLPGMGIAPPKKELPKQESVTQSQSSATASAADVNSHSETSSNSLSSSENTTLADANHNASGEQNYADSSANSYASEPITHDFMTHSVKYVTQQQDQTDDIVNSFLAAKHRKENIAAASAEEAASEPKNESKSSGGLLSRLSSSTAESSSVSPFTKLGAIHSSTDFVKSLESLTDFRVSNINSDWVEQQFTKTPYINPSAEQCHKFLSNFFSRSTGDFYSEVMISELQSLLPADNITPIAALNAGCAKGHEAFSLAAAILQKYNNSLFRLWAHDIDLVAVSNAPTLDLSELASIGKLSTFMENGPQGKRFVKRVSDSILFEYHNIVNDSDFPELDIIVARDVLSYISSDKVEAVINSFVSVLKSGCHIIFGDNEVVKHNQLEKVDSSFFNVYIKK